MKRGNQKASPKYASFQIQKDQAELEREEEQRKKKMLLDEKLRPVTLIRSE